MNRWGLFRIRNAMLVANLISNVVGGCVVLFLSQTTRQTSEEVSELTLRINRVFLPCSFLLPLVLTVLYEKPIRSYIRKASLQSPVSEKERGEARKRLLNEPFFLIALDMGVWFAAALIYSAVFWSYGVGWATVRSASRVQRLNKEFGTEILITAVTRAALDGHFSLRGLPATPVKGKSGLIDLYPVE